LLVLCLGGKSSALDPGSLRPYKLTVALRVAEHPLLTPVFKEQLKRELADSLQNAFTPALVKVEVSDTHPILAEVEKRGLRQALDAYQDADPVKTHVVVVDYVDGKYEIQAAQHDGLTGLTTPVIRKALLDDPSGRQVVARTAARLVETDFGMVGTVVGDTKQPHKIQLALQGGKLGVPLGPWVKKDDVFAVVQVNRRGGMEPVRETLLQVDTPPSADGVVTCRLFARRPEEPAAQLANVPGLDGYRCLKLGTANAPLRLRLVNERGLPHANLQVKAGRGGFDTASGAPTFAGSTNRDGFLETRDKFSHAAFVLVNHGESLVARLPVPIVQDQVAVYTVVLDPNISKLGNLTALRDRFNRRLDGSLLLQVDLSKALGALLAEKRFQEALDEASKNRARLQRDLKEAEAEFNQLQAQVTKASLPAGVEKNLLDDDGRREQLKRYATALDDFVGRWKKVIDQDNAARERDALVERARLLADAEARYDEAIKLYAEAVQKYPTPKLEATLNQLKAAWALKNDQGHADARRYIYEKWSKLDATEKLRDNLDIARQHLEECKKVGDRLTPRMLLRAGVTHAQLVGQQMAALEGRLDRQAEREKYEALKLLRDGLRKLLDEAKAFVAQK